MPTYDFECKRCGHVFSRLQKMSDPPLEICPECGGELRKLFSSDIGFIIKGTRWAPSSAALNDNSRDCGHASPCCGRETPCDKKPCE